jgi:propanol-preferring alcohol dehydrogenase
MIEGDWVAAGVPARTPIVPGHEVVETVAAVGDGVNWLHVGERVGVQPLWSRWVQKLGRHAATW